ncbi:hypothetical protein HN011_011883 [Eciton burchellii]|nr:hypothetical protein HN011_011883 [Eciton burchellii]
MDTLQEIEMGEMGYTEQLLSWINKLSSKKRKTRYNYFRRALLNHARNQAIIKLRTKQELRKNRWLKLRKDLLKDTTSNTTKFHIEEEQKGDVPDVGDVGDVQQDVSEKQCD